MAEQDDAASTTITETEFLITELRYTLGQVHVQLLDLSPDVLNTSAGAGATIQQTLDRMLHDETTNQAAYASMLGRSVPEAQEHDVLPIAETDRGSGGEIDIIRQFEHARAQTIALLQQAENTWPEELVQRVRAQVSQDRAYATQLADARRSVLESRDEGEDRPLTRPE